jgi:L-threonylcarbamoyladenylate synthase
LLASSIDWVEKNLCYLSKTDKEYLSDYWPGPYTSLQTQKENIPSHLKNDTNKLAIRVSNHLPIKLLFKGFNGFIVSTSANISGKKNINDAHNIIDFFESDGLAYDDESRGENNSTSKIIDLESKAIIRA